MHGIQDGGGSTSSEIIFDSGEFITQIEGHSNTTLIQQLTLVTTTRMLRCPQPLYSTIPQWVEI